VRRSLVFSSYRRGILKAKENIYPQTFMLSRFEAQNVNEDNQLLLQKNCFYTSSLFNTSFITLLKCLQYFIAKICSSSCCFKVHAVALDDDSESICAGESD